MNQSKITVRYAKALFDVAKEKNVLKEIKEDIQGILAVFAESQDLNYLLTSPVYSTSQKKQVLTETFSKKVNQFTSSFLTMLVDNKREAYLKNIALYFNDLVKKDLGIQSVSIKSASELSKDAEATLVKAVKEAYNTDVELETSVDESLIGGFILRVDDKQLDASVATSLRTIKRELSDKK